MDRGDVRLLHVSWDCCYWTVLAVDGHPIANVIVLMVGRNSRCQRRARSYGKTHIKDRKEYRGDPTKVISATLKTKASQWVTAPSAALPISVDNDEH